MAGTYSKTVNFFILFFAVIIILIYGKNILIPFVLALFLWFLVRELKQLLDKVPFIKNKFPGWLKNLFITMLIVGFSMLISSILINSIVNLSKSYQLYQHNINNFINKVNLSFGVDIQNLLQEKIGTFDFGNLLGTVLDTFTNLFGNVFIVIIYVLFIFMEQVYFSAKLKKAFGNTERYDRFMHLIEPVESAIAKYLGIKTLLSLLTGVVSYTILLIIGIESPAFWAFLIFGLNYIPNIGSLIATLFPSVFCILQFGSFNQALLVLLCIGAVQVLIGNILEPKLMGNSLNISPLVAIIALVVWGALWGIIGMVLSIPITVIMVIIMSKIPETKRIAIMLSDKGDIVE